MQRAKRIFNCRNLSFWLMQKVFSSHYSIVFQQGFSCNNFGAYFSLLDSAAEIRQVCGHEHEDAKLSTTGHLIFLIALLCT